MFGLIVNRFQTTQNTPKLQADVNFALKLIILWNFF